MLLRLIQVEKGLCLTGMAISGALLVALVLMSGCNVAMRVAGHPVSASYELSGFFGALIAALALADTQRKRGHVELDLFTSKYSEGARRWIGAFNVLAGALLMAVLVVGKRVHGARSWLALGPVSFEPVELARIGYILVLAAILDAGRPASEVCRRFEPLPQMLESVPTPQRPRRC